MMAMMTVQPPRRCRAGKDARLVGAAAATAGRTRTAAGRPCTATWRMPGDAGQTAGAWLAAVPRGAWIKAATEPAGGRGIRGEHCDGAGAGTPGEPVLPGAAGLLGEMQRPRTEAQN